MDSRNNKIGVFDSGVGGLTILKAIQENLPNENILYLADQAHVPYGSRQLEEIKKFSKVIVKFLIENGAKLIVVACNTASAAALYYLREEFPNIPFIGMEPALKPAVEKTETNVVGVLATKATFQGELYASVVERFANNVRLIQDPCVGLVEQIEEGNLDGEDTKLILDRALAPMIEENIDTVVLGCTHFPFVFPLIKNIVGENVRLINPAPAIARQVERVLDNKSIRSKAQEPGKIEFSTTGYLKPYEEFLQKFNFYGKVKNIKWGIDLNY